MRIRTAEPSDLEAIVAILNEAIAERAVAYLDPQTSTDRRDWLAAHKSDRRPVLVAEVASPPGDGADLSTGAQIVGWASLGDYRPGRRALRQTAELSYFVAAAHRRRGVATALIGAAVERCPALGIESLIAILLADNHASIRLLEGCGFARWGSLPAVATIGDRKVSHLYYGRRLT